MSPGGPHHQQPVTSIARTDFPLLRDTMTVGEALASIREQGVGERIVTVPEAASVLEACEALVMHRFLALPVVDGERRIVGVIDIEMLNEEVVDLAERQQAETMFETLGFRLGEVRDAAHHREFRFRFPWLLATIASGLTCALFLSRFEATLAESLVLAFFLALVLGLGESVSMRSMSMTIQALRAGKLTKGAYVAALRRELLIAPMLGAASGGLVALVALAWRGDASAALVIGAGILSWLVLACVFGLSVPWLLHALRLDPKIAAGPLTLALADVTTVALYLSAARPIL